MLSAVLLLNYLEARLVVHSIYARQRVMELCAESDSRFI